MSTTACSPPHPAMACQQPHINTIAESDENARIHRAFSSLAQCQAGQCLRLLPLTVAKAAISRPISNNIALPSAGTALTAPPPSPIVAFNEVVTTMLTPPLAMVTAGLFW